MSDAVFPVTQTRHAHAVWKKPADYRFAAGTIMVPLSAQELTKAALAFPLTIMRQGNALTLGAILGLVPGQNLHIGPKGQWLASYIPAALRSGPFLVRPDETGKQVLCVDEANPFFSASPTEGGGEPVFGEGGEISPSTQDIMSFLTQVQEGQAVLQGAVAELNGAGVLEAWPVSIQNPNPSEGRASQKDTDRKDAAGGEVKVEGLFRVSEATLNGLDDEKFVRLRKSGALSVAYAQALSTGHMQILRQRHKAVMDSRQPPQTPAIGDMAGTDSLDIDWSKI